MLENNELVGSMAEVLGEFMTLTELEWDRAFFRYVEYGPGHQSRQWSYVFNNNLELASLDDGLTHEYFNTLAALSKELCNDLEAADKKRPIVVVVEVDKSLRFQVKFDYRDIKGLEISKLSLGKPNSYLFGTDINIPKEVLDFQNELAKRS